MTEHPEYPEAGGSGTCRFSSERLLPLLDNFEKEIGGVGEGADIEYIHRMRVASRRLRAALPLFEPCFPRKQYRTFTSELRKVTRALGEARDADVQIEFLRSYAKKLKRKLANTKRTGRSTRSTDALLREIGNFITRMVKKRAGQQDAVLESLSVLERSAVIGDMRQAFSIRLNDTHRLRRRFFAAGIPAVAADQIISCLNVFLSYEPYLSDPDAILEHHAMRIAAKKLRYTLEVYAPVYRLGLGKPLRRVKKIQEILGDIHDCDVWIDLLTTMIVKQRSRPRIGSADRADRHTLTGIRLFLHDRERLRHILHNRLLQNWSTLTRAGAWEELRMSLLEARKSGFILKEPGYDQIRLEVNDIASEYPEVLTHVRHVTSLSLSLFDQTISVHQFGLRERSLLEYAGLLHDIGWRYGHKEHSSKSRDMILRDERIQLDLTSRAIVGIVAWTHRKMVVPEDDPLYSLLPAESQRTAVILAGILRLADGLDYLHSSGISGISCTVTTDAVIIDVEAPGDVSSERSRAQAKSDLLSRAFSFTVEIR
jgi:CHAD domain-containing protein